MDAIVKGYLLDTNILIYYWNGEIPPSELDVVEDVLRHSFTVSIITKIELLGWRKHTSEGFIKAREFLSRAEVIFIDEDVAELTIELKRTKNIKLADALIASTALLNDLVLATRNVDDFSMIDGLEIYNPFQVKRSDLII